MALNELEKRMQTLKSIYMAKYFVIILYEINKNN